MNIVPGDPVTSIGEFTLVIDSEVIVRGGMQGTSARERDSLILHFIDIVDSVFPFTSTVPFSDQVGAISYGHFVLYRCGE